MNWRLPDRPQWAHLCHHANENPTPVWDEQAGVMLLVHLPAGRHQNRHLKRMRARLVVLHATPLDVAVVQAEPVLQASPHRLASKHLNHLPHRPSSSVPPGGCWSGVPPAEASALSAVVQAVERGRFQASRRANRPDRPRDHVGLTFLCWFLTKYGRTAAPPNGAAGIYGHLQDTEKAPGPEPGACRRRPKDR